MFHCKIAEIIQTLFVLAKGLVNIGVYFKKNEALLLEYKKLPGDIIVKIPDLLC